MGVLMDQVEGIVLAGGLSKRAQAFKLTLDLYGKTVIENCIESMYQVCDRIIVVGGYRFEEVANVVKHYNKIELVFNEHYHHGMFSSVKRGLSSLKGTRFFLTPGDYPAIATETYINMLHIEAPIVIPSHRNELGHPVLMKSYLKEEILTPARGVNYISLRDFIAEKGFVTLEVMDQGIVLDIDTSEDYNLLCLYLSKIR